MFGVGHWNVLKRELELGQTRNRDNMRTTMHTSILPGDVMKWDDPA